MNNYFKCIHYIIFILINDEKFKGPLEGTGDVISSESPSIKRHVRFKGPLEGTGDVISSESPSIKRHVRFVTAPRKLCQIKNSADIHHFLFHG